MATNENLFIGIPTASEDTPRTASRKALEIPCASAANELTSLALKLQDVDDTLQQVLAEHSVQIKALQNAQKEQSLDLVRRLKDFAIDTELQKWRMQVDVRLDFLERSKNGSASVQGEIFTREVLLDSAPVSKESQQQLHLQMEDVLKKFANQEAELSQTRQMFDTRLQQCVDSRLGSIETELSTVKDLQRIVDELKPALAKQNAQGAHIQLDNQDSQTSVEYGGSHDKDVPKLGPHVSDLSSPVCERAFEIEQNVYGLMMMPSKPVRAASLLVLLIHYTLVVGLSWMIFDKCYEAQRGEADALTNLCDDVDGVWDCSEPSLRDMLIFDIMDADGDGVWSLPEARASGKLSNFQALHRVASAHNDFLRVVAPAHPAEPNYICASLVPIFSIMLTAGLIGINETERLVFASMQTFVSNITVDDMRDITNLKAKEKNYCGLPPDSPEVLVDCALPALCEYNEFFPSIEGISSEQIYATLTSQFFFFPKSIFEALAQNILRPCLLLDRDQCANAEIKSNFLREVPMWQNLDSAERVRRCRFHVASVCPDILEDQFESFAKQTQSICGAPMYDRQVVATPARHAQQDTPYCQDDDIALRQFTAAFILNDPVYAMVIEELGGLSKMSCQLSMVLGLCQTPFGVPNANGANGTEQTIFFEVLSRLCPDTCCYRQGNPLLPLTPVHIPLACNDRCFEVDKHGRPNFATSTKGGIRKECFGQSCQYLHVSEQRVGNVRIAFHGESFGAYDTMRLVFHSNRSLYVNVREVFSGGSPSCLTNSLRIHGTRVCAENLRQHSRVFIPLRATDRFEILFEPSLTDDCTTSCNWDILITDAGERDEFALIQVSFENQVHLSRESGVRKPAFGLFFCLILMVWVMFMFIELIKIKQSVFFILEYPELGSGQYRAMLLMCSALPRFLLCMWALYLGVILLTLVTEYVEMVLNGMALAFIMDIDEVLYHIMVPKSVKQVLENLGTFVWPSRRIFVIPNWVHARVEANMEIFAFTMLMMSIAGFFVLWEYLRTYGFLHMGSMMDCVCLLQGSACASGVLN